ncbi:hypothetical protein [Methylomagnum sp.]
MNDFNFQDIMQNLADNGITANTATLIAIGIFGLLVAVYLVIKLSRSKQATPPAKAPVVAARQAPKAPEPVIPKTPKPAEAVQTRQPPPPAPAAAPVPKAAVAQRPAIPAFGRHVPQDSVLKRHFQAHICHMLETVAAPRPTDSVLKRHHQHLLQSRLQACLRDKACRDKLTAEYEACRASKAATVAPTPAPVMDIPAPASAPVVAIAAPAPSQPAKSAPAAVQIPQDSILRRHFLNHLAYMLEAIAPCRPTDSVLKRHHAQWLRNQLDACLSDPARLNKVLSDYESGRIAKA